MARWIINLVFCAAVSFFGLVGCGQSERARIEIDFSNASEWKYMLGVDIYGTPLSGDSGQYYSGSLRAYLHGLPPDRSVGPLSCGFSDVTLVAPFLPEDERGDIHRRLTDLRVSISEDGVVLSDTAGIPGVMSSAWDILRSPARVIPAMPNADMTVGSSWEREQRFPLSIPHGEAEGLMYQMYTLDSLYKTASGFSAAAVSWTFRYTVAAVENKGESAGKNPRKKYLLAGSGRGNAVLDLNRKKLLKSQATFQVTHSEVAGMDVNEVVHFEIVE